MANVCMASVVVERLESVDGVSSVPLHFETITERLENLHYDLFEVCCADEDRIEIDCGFRWLPPFDELLAITADLHLTMRCTYEEPGSCFMGAWRAEDGKVVQDDCIDY
jgi:hypothetical protein